MESFFYACKYDNHLQDFIGDCKVKGINIVQALYIIILKNLLEIYSQSIQQNYSSKIK